ALATVLFSPDSKRVAYIAVRGAQYQERLGGNLVKGIGGKWSIFVDGQQGREYDFIDQVTFSPDSKHVACVARHGDKEIVVVDGVEAERYDALPEGSRLVFDSPSLLHTLAARGKEFFRVVVELSDDKSSM